MSVGVNGKVYSKHGTQIDTRITVIDKVPADNPGDIPCISETLDLPELLALIEHLPLRSSWERSEEVKHAAKAIVVQLPKRTTIAQPETVSSLPDDIVVLEYEVVEWSATEGLKDTLYETYRPQRIRIKNALPHPSLLCESAALALVSPPAPTYKPYLPQNIVTQGLLSEAQLESVIYAGQAHCEFLSGSYIVDDSWDNVTVAATSSENAVRFRRGWFLGDGTGAGKGRQCAGIILDNWCQERRKAIWVSKSSALIEDARRDWCALGGSEKDIDAFQVIHNNLEKALEACNITGAKTYNRAAKMSAKSQFESHKQRFFNHLLTGMKCPQLIKAIEEDLAAQNAVVIQIVSTNEELLKRRLNEVVPEEWKDLNLDLTPREYVMDYLMSAFPIHLHSIHSGVDGEERSEPVFDADGSPVISIEAVALRDALVDKLASLDPIPGALEQLLWHFGHKQIAEVTGRSKRVLKDDSGRLFVDSRGSGANIAETAAFMQGDKQILIFSDAGGTGRSYHAADFSR